MPDAAHFNNPQHWLDRAEEARTVAGVMRDAVAKGMMLKIAEDYDKLAARASQRQDSMPAVAAYRFYEVDANGHIHAPPHLIDLRSDEEAEKVARALAHATDIEVWDGKRRVAVVKADQAG